MTDRKFKSMGNNLHSILDPTMRRIMEIITANINTIRIHGNNDLLEEDDHPQYVTKDITREVTVGYTTETEDVGSIGSGILIPDFQKEHLKLLIVTGNFTLNKPDYNGHCEYYITVDSGGPYTITAGTHVVFIDSVNTVVASRDYLLNIRRFTEEKVVCQLVLVQFTTTVVADTPNLILAPVDATITTETETRVTATTGDLELAPVDATVTTA